MTIQNITILYLLGLVLALVISMLLASFCMQITRNMFKRGEFHCFHCYIRERFEDALAVCWFFSYGAVLDAIVTTLLVIFRYQMQFAYSRWLLVAVWVVSLAFRGVSQSVVRTFAELDDADAFFDDEHEENSAE